MSLIRHGLNVYVRNAIARDSLSALFSHFKRIAQLTKKKSKQF